MNETMTAPARKTPVAAPAAGEQTPAAAPPKSSPSIDGPPVSSAGRPGRPVRVPVSRLRQSLSRPPRRVSPAPPVAVPVVSTVLWSGKFSLYEMMECNARTCGLSFEAYVKLVTDGCNLFPPSWIAQAEMERRAEMLLYRRFRAAGPGTRAVPYAEYIRLMVDLKRLRCSTLNGRLREGCRRCRMCYDDYAELLLSLGKLTPADMRRAEAEERRDFPGPVLKAAKMERGAKA